MHAILLIMIAVSLSMDAFSLSLAYGTLNLTKKEIGILSIIVATFHLFMPLIGYSIGISIMHFIPIKPEMIVFVVLFFIGVEMIIDSFKEEEVTKLLSFIELLLFGFAVSIDSFSVGLGFPSLTHHYFLVALLFSLCSGLFTYLGLILGKKINNKIGKVSTLLGGIILIVIGILYLF